MDDEELFLCKGEDFDCKWFVENDLPTDLYRAYRDIKIDKSIQPLCNTDKASTTCCALKVKTRGLILACDPCGMIIGFKEMFGAESCTQVALFYLEIRNSYTGKSSHYL